MKQIHYTFFSMVLLSAVLYSGNVLAQTVTKHILVASGGVFGASGNKVRVGSYQLTNKTFTNFDSFPGNSVTEFAVDGNEAYLATDAGLYKYDLNNLVRVKSNTEEGLRRLAVYGNYVVATINDYYTSARLKIFNKSDLSLAYTDTTLSTVGEGIAISGDTAYIALQGNYPYKGDTGKIAVYDLKNRMVKRNIILDTATKGINKIYTNGNLVVAETEYPNARITVYDISKGTYKISNPGSDLFGAFAFMNNKLYANFGSGIATFDATTNTVSPVIVQDAYYAAAAYDTVHKEFYYTSMSYTRPGMAYRVSNNVVTDSFQVGASPEAMAVSYGSASGIEDASNELNFSIYPNPSSDIINLALPENAKYTVSITDMAGKTYKALIINDNKASINVNDIPSGIYLIRVQSGNSLSVKKLIRN